jgi:hypothetical protein
LKKIPCPGDRVGPGFGRTGHETPLNLFLSAFHGGLMGMDLLDPLAPGFGRLSRGLPAAPVEIDRIVRHHGLSVIVFATA